MKAFSWLLCHIPERCLDFFAKTLAFVIFDIFRIRRRLILSNIATALGPPSGGVSYTSIGRQSVYHFLLTILEILRSPKYPLDTHFEFHGLEHLKGALQDGGAFVIVCHLANFEAMATLVSKYVARVVSPVKRIGSKGTTRFITELRTANGFTAHVRAKRGDGLRLILEALQARQVVGFMMDQSRPGEPKLPFFGRDAKTNTSLAAIVARSGRPVLPGWCVRRGFNRHAIYFLPPVENIATSDPQADIIANTRQYSKAVEAMILQKPEQYFWMHDRWKK